MKSLAKWGVALAVAWAVAASLPARGETRSVVPLDRGWEFYAVPDFNLWPAEPSLTEARIAQLRCPAPGEGWQPVQLPDDYVVRGSISRQPNAALLAQGAIGPLGGREFEIPVAGHPAHQGRMGALDRPGRDAYGGHGYLPVYPAWYRRQIAIPASSAGRSVWLDFGGVYRDAIVFVNGQFIEQHASGYTGFRLDITAAVKGGATNEVEVFVDPRWFEGWWYEGGGIYRHVRLVTADRLQVAPWGTFVDATVTGPVVHDSSEGDCAAARLAISTTVRNDHATGRSFTLVSRVIDPSGKPVASVSSPEEVAAGQEETFAQEIALPEALLWSLEHPNLYRLETVLRAGGAEVDGDATDFGVRSLRFDPNQGFFLNGQRVEIRGVCNHQDFPAVGIAAPDDLWTWRIAKLKAMGANAYRCSHNPVSEAFYEAADRMGLLVMDETRHLGDTYFPKSDQTTPDNDPSEVEAMVRQHRNHPSIIMWSLANEEGVGPTPYGARIYAAMKAAVKRLDPSRPVTGAINGGYTKEGYISVEDILGMNYHNPEFDRNHAEFPNLMIFGSEDSNAKTSRGSLETSRATGRCSEYGAESAGGEPWRSWAPVAARPFVAGEFVWTGFDYRGEPNPFSWPAVTSQTGCMDLAGFPKPVYHYWQAAWQSRPSVTIFPDWNLPGSMAGRMVRVRAFSNCERVGLSLNGRSLGVQAMPPNQYVDWQVAYEPGTLTATGYNGSSAAAHYAVETTGAPAALRLTAEKTGPMAADGEEVAPIAVAVVDAEGRVVPEADDLIAFSVSGAGTLAGVANGDPSSHESNVGAQRRAFHGLCLAVVRAGDRPGTITLEAAAPGLKPAQIAIESE